MDSVGICRGFIEIMYEWKGGGYRIYNLIFYLYRLEDRKIFYFY